VILGSGGNAVFLMSSCDSIVEIFFPSNMSVFRKVVFTDLWINECPLALTSEEPINECEVYQLRGRLVETFPKYRLFLNLSPQAKAHFERQS